MSPGPQQILQRKPATAAPPVYRPVQAAASAPPVYRPAVPAPPQIRRGTAAAGSVQRMQAPTDRTRTDPAFNKFRLPQAEYHPTSGLDDHIPHDWAQKAAELELNRNTGTYTAWPEWGGGLSGGFPPDVHFEYVVKNEPGRGRIVLVSEQNVLHHHILAKKTAVIFAGTAVFKSGRLIYWTNATGHYMPSSVGNIKLGASFILPSERYVSVYGGGMADDEYEAGRIGRDIHKNLKALKHLYDQTQQNAALYETKKEST